MSNWKEEIIWDVLNGLYWAIKSENIEEYEKSGIKLPQFNSCQDFFIKITYPYVRLVHWYLASLKATDNTEFLLLNSDYIENHLDQIFSTHEGWACSHDKTIFVIEWLLRLYQKWEPMKFLHEGSSEHFWIPQVVLNCQSKCEQFFEAIKLLYYWKPLKYLEFYKKLIKETPST